MPEKTGARDKPWAIRLLNVLIFLALFCVSVSVSIRYTHGDLWLDEADYAVAALHPAQDNRWDRSDKPDQPDLLIRLRHYHAPLTALILAAAHHYGSDEETLRIPFVIAGGLSVGLVYICGLALFGGRREIAAACGLLVAFTPANIRMASHAIPWSFIILELVCLLLAAVRFAQTRRPSCLIWIGLVMGLLFATSETFFVAAVTLAIVVAITLAPDIASARKQTSGAPAAPGMIDCRQLVKCALAGAAAFLTVAIIIWPAGLRGHCLTMLKHYIDMRTSEAFPVNIGSVVYKTAPKWAYLYWYYKWFPTFLAWYIAGLGAVLMITISRIGKLFHVPRNSVEGKRARQVPAGAEALLVFTVVLLISAHQAHIIGAEYLAHCLPFMTLCAGYVLLLIGNMNRLVGYAAVAAVAVVFACWMPSHMLPGMDARTQMPRWRQAASVIAPQWKPLDRLLVGPQSPNVAYWYLHEYAHVPLHDWQVGQFALAGPGPNFLQNMTIGKYRWVAISSQFEDKVINAVDARSMAILNTWQLALTSEEDGLGPPRLTLYRCPISLFAPPQ
jgi:uncharacterized membrane protein